MHDTIEIIVERVGDRVGDRVGRGVIRWDSKNVQ